MKIPEYQVWVDMRRRCSNPASKQYKDYGGRGITVCKRWNSFALFLQDIGLRPGGRREYTLERKNNNKGYSPSNCKWATWKEQAQNRRFRKSSPSGEENGQSKLTELQVQFIRLNFKTNNPAKSVLSAQYLAQKFKVALSTVYRVANNKYWKGV